MRSLRPFPSADLLAWAATITVASALQPQEVPFVSVGVKAPVAAPFTVPQFSSVGLPVAWEVLVGPSGVSGNTVTLTGINGPVTMRGRQAGDAVHDPAPDRYLTFTVDTGGGFLRISAGDTHVVGIKSDGTLWSWGSNTQGQLGDGTTTGHAAPALVTVPTADPWTDVACASAHTVARRADGSLWAWGANTDGQLGLGNTVDRTFPTRIGALTSWAGVACGANHTIAWKTDGTLWTWGDNLQGQLGDNTIADRTSPVRVGTASDWVEAAGGSLHTIGRRAGGSLWCWGLNTSGQLGDGTTTRRLTPVRVGLDSNWAQVSAGFVFSAARRSNGTLWAWGNNGSGQLGQGNNTSASAPQQVGTGTDWAAIHCGAACAIGRRNNGYLWAWGDNSAGQLGDGTTADQLLPLQTLEGPWSSLTVGAACVLGVRSSYIWSWGTNDFEQLGLPAGTTVVSAVPPGSRLPAPYPQSAVAPPAAVGVNQIFSPAVTSALPPFVTVLSGPAVVSADGHRLSFTAGGTVQYQVSHPGDSSWQPVTAQNFTLSIINAAGPVFTAAPTNQFVQLATPAGTIVNFTAAAMTAVTGPATVVCVPPSGSLFPGGITTVTCTADDGLLNFTTHTFTVTVNRRPVPASFAAPSLPPSIPFTLSATDADGDATTLSIVTPPANGTLSGTMPNFTFTPNTGFTGITTLTYKANDGTIDSLPATVTLEVLNFIPVVNAQSLATSAFAPLPITLTGSDGNGQSLTYSIVTPPVKGALSGTAPNLIYTPGSGAEGPDSFTFRAFDGIVFSDPATVSILVNDTPAVPGRNLTTPEDTALPIILNGTDPNNQSLTFSVITPPAHGSLSGAGASLTYTPAPNYFGPDGFTCKASDGYVDSPPGAVSINVQPVNDRPLAVAQSVSANEDTALPVTLTGTDVELSPLSFAVTLPPAHGALSGTAPNLTYTPAANYFGPDNFSFTVDDGDLTSVPAVVTIAVVAVNHVPVASPAANVGIQSPVAPPFALPALSSAGLPVTWEALAGPASVSGNTVTVTGSLGAVTLRGRQAGDAVYDPAPDRYLTFTVDTGGGFLRISAGDTHVVGIKSDGTLWSWGSNTQGQLGDGTTTGHAAPALVTVPTSAPWLDVACGSAHTVGRRADGSLWAWGSNSDGQLGLGSTVDRLFPTRIGTLTTWAGVACGANHTMAWKTDGTLWTWGDNREGQLGDNTIADRTSPVRVGTASDWVEVAGGSQHTVGRRAGGSLWCWGSNTSGQLGDGTTTRRLTPVRVGTDSNWAQVSAGFVFSAARRTNSTLWAWGNNASGQLGQGTNAPSSTPLQVGTATDWAGIHCGAACAIGRRNNGYLWAWGDNSAGQLGDGTTANQLLPLQTLEGPWSSLTVGAACVLGVRSSYIWSWGTNDFEQLGLPAGTTVVSAVPPGSRLPAPYPQSAVAPPAAVGVNQIFSPAVTSALPPFVTVLSGPAVVSADGHRLSFTAGGTVQYQLSHPGDSSWQPVTAQNFTLSIIDATGPVFTAAPTNQFVQLATPAGTIVNFTAAAMDAVTGPATVVCVPPSGSLFPGGITTVTCTADDGLLNFTTHTFTVTVNRRPVPASFAAPSLPPSIPFTLSATDADGDATTLSIVTPPANGTLSGTMPNFTFTPNTGFVGITTLTYKANDGSIDSLPATVTLEVLNFIPVVNAQSLATSAFAPLPITLTGSDGNGQSLTYSIVTPPVKGALSGTAPNLIYTPGSGAEGPDSFTFRAFDGIVFSDPATVSILVNDTPAVPGRNLTTPEDTALPIILNGTDPNNQSLTFSVITPPAHGSLSGAGASLTYTPAPNYFGPDGFTCKASDGYVDSPPGAVSINVQPVNDRPLAVAQSVSANEDSSLPVTLTGTDVELSPLSFAVTLPPAHGALSGTAPNLTYTPAANYFGPDNFSFTVDDGDLTSVPAVVTIAVVAVNHVPVASPAAYTRAANTSLKIDIASLIRDFTSDPDNDPRTLQSVGASAQGATVSIGGPWILYSPVNNNSDSFSYTISDGRGQTATGTISVTVVPLEGKIGSFTLNGDGHPVMEFAGIPGYLYAIERSQNLLAWAPVHITRAPVTGVFSFTDTSPPGGSVFYRMIYRPGP